MRTIKFRGKTSTGDSMYGNLTQDGKEFYISDGKRLAYVKPDSVAQLVYTDKNGKEYYENDILIKDGRKWRCKIVMDWQEVSQ